MLLAVSFKLSPTHIGPLLPGTGLSKSQVLQNFCHALPSHILIQFEVVFKIINPNAGATIESRCTCERRGINKPLLVEFTSYIADEAGGVPDGLILTPPIWQNADMLIVISRIVKSLFIQ